LEGKVRFSLRTSHVARQPRAYSGFCSMKRLAVFYSPLLDGMLVYRRLTRSIKFASTHLYTLVKTGTVKVKCLAQELTTLTPAQLRHVTESSALTMKEKCLLYSLR